MTTPAAMHVVFSGGGTGGHLFPGLTVAARLREELPGVRITFAGSGRPFERPRVAAAGFDYLSLTCRPLPRGLLGWPGFLAGNLAGYWQARQFLLARRAAVVVGLGGFASVPMARAAVALGVPLVLLEQNAVPGRATRWLARSATAVCLALDEARRHLPAGCTVRLTGNPVRPEFFERHRALRRSRSPRVCAGAAGEAERESGTAPHRQTCLDDLPGRSARPRRLLVLGGSGGARTLNEQVPLALRRIRGQFSGWTILHQSGEAGWDLARAAYDQAGVRAKVVPFIADMPAALAASGLAISRAGGTTLAELAAAGVPAILIPYPHAAEDHQRRNAEAFVAAGACAMLDERESAGRLPARLADVLELMLTDQSLRTDMARSLERLAHRDAARSVVEIIRIAAKRAALSRARGSRSVA